jgi:gamma-glutamyltranspeptidase/glutathione hydrolase
MRGAVAAGHPLTAEAGARVLADGGNAVDACVAAGLASWVAESPLTGPGGGGFMLVHRAHDRSTRVLDFFTAMPGLGLDGAGPGRMDEVDVDFSGGSTQVFEIGAASCAVPGTTHGLEAAHRSFGTLPWATLFEPALELARTGVELTREQAYLHAILDLILRHTAEGRAIYGERDRLAAGDRLVMADLAGTLELLAREGAAALQRGDLAEALVAHVRAGGGTITARDLAEYRVIRRRPIRAEYAGHEFLSNPPPSHGGVLIAYALRLLDRLDGGAAGSAEALAALAGVMREAGRARGLDRRRLEAGENDALDRIAQGVAAEREAAEPSGTTHISVVDGAGNAAALTVSTGAGSGVVVPGTGIQLNNMLGEFHLDRPPRAGARLASMMSPSLVLRDGRPRLVVGSAGSLRLRNAVLQIVVNVVGHGLPVEEAIDRPRIHLEEPQLHCEGGHDAAELDRLEARGWELVRWRRQNLFFGGVSAVEVREDGTLAAAGDPRRGGSGLVT